MANPETEYRLVHVGKGWQCRVAGSRACGWGSRPELAIRDWKQQHRLLTVAVAGESLRNHLRRCGRTVEGGRNV